jgi:hypothetical protein
LFPAQMPRKLEQSNRRAGALIALFIGVLLTAACGPQVVVNAGPSVPSMIPMEAGPHLTEHSAVVAYEYGLCEDDADCTPVGCGGAVCASDSDPAVCLISDVSACMARVTPTDCGCVFGACRWARSAEVLQCSGLAEPITGDRGFRRLHPLEEYPARLTD